jgi:hypothetical protein
MEDFNKTARIKAQATYPESEPADAESILKQAAYVSGALWAAEEMLNYSMRLCGSGMTIGMLRVRLHNRLVEILSKGERG